MPFPQEKRRRAMAATRRRRSARARLAEASRRRVSMVRSHGIFVLPNLFTSASLFCAFIAIVRAIAGEFGQASLLIILAMFFDGLDGRVARLTHTQSEFGVQFDSLADVIAFGLAPALIVHRFCLSQLGAYGWAAAFVYILCAAVRLARFNCNVTVVDKRFFQGLPSPAAAGILVCFVWQATSGTTVIPWGGHQAWAAFLLTLWAGLSMVSNVPYYSAKSATGLARASCGAIAIGSLIFIIVSGEPSLALFALACLYALSGWLYAAFLFLLDRPSPVRPPQERDQSETPSATREQ